MKRYFTKFVFVGFLFFVSVTNVLANQSTSLSNSSSYPAITIAETSTASTLTDISKSLENLNEKIKGQGQLALVPAVSSFLGAVLGAIITLRTSSADRRADERSLLLDSLKWFEGGIQKRGIGISVIDGHWKKFPDLKATWVAVLASQAIYILSKSYKEEHGKPILLPEHEFLNLDRIVELLKRGIPKVKDKLLTGNPNQEVHDAFKKAIERHKIEEEKLSKAIESSKTEEEKSSNKKFFGDIEKSRKRLGKIEAKF